ncbi:MAG: NUDIX hydrolase [Ignavibacteria bacterium]|nr:NUDIX hydrolase [Ignavibacteria bacterium]
MRTKILQLISTIKPYDKLEEEHITNTIKWINSGEEIFRIQKPDTPTKHLVSYFVLIDKEKKKILLMDHINAGLWLPSGGHVELNEHPKDTVKREITEELNLAANFISENPFFITQTITVNIGAGHTDVSLWYLLHGNSEDEISFDKNEFNGYKWFGYNEILEADSRKLDPYMHRFIEKLLNSKHLT